MRPRFEVRWNRLAWLVFDTKRGEEVATYADQCVAQEVAAAANALALLHQVKLAAVHPENAPTAWKV